MFSLILISQHKKNLGYKTINHLTSVLDCEDVLFDLLDWPLFWLDGGDLDCGTF